MDVIVPPNFTDFRRENCMMQGILYKDFIQLKKEFKISYALLMFLPCISGLTNKHFFLPIFGILMSLFWGTFVLSGLGKDQACNWRKNSLSFPITKGTLVLEKYLFSLILNLTAFCLVFLTGLLAQSFFSLSFREILIYSAYSGIFSFIFCTLIIPLAFRFGVDSCRYFIFGFASLPGIILVVFNWLNIDYVRYLSSLSLSNSQFISLTIFMLLLWVSVSFYLSLRWYKKFI